jgi:pyridoxine 5-phosphate synthase
VELWTGGYAHAQGPQATRQAVETLIAALELGWDHGLEVHAGHGLTYRNIDALAALGGFSEFNIGHSIVSRAVLVGMRAAVREMKYLLDRGLSRAEYGDDFALEEGPLA